MAGMAELTAGWMAVLTDRPAFSGHPLADSPVDAPHTFDTESVVCLYRPRADWPDPALSVKPVAWVWVGVWVSLP